MASKKGTSFFSGLTSAGSGLKVLTSLRTPDGGTPTVSSEVTDYPPPERDPQSAKDGGNLKYPDKPKKTLSPAEQSSQLILPLNSPIQNIRGWVPSQGHTGWDLSSGRIELYAVADGVVQKQPESRPYNPSGWPAALQEIKEKGATPWSMDACNIAYKYIHNCNGNAIVVLSTFDPPLSGGYTQFVWGYCHMVAPTKWEAGDKIKKGDYIGDFGNTGFTEGADAGPVSRVGAHLHFYIQSPSIDPLVLYTSLGLYP